MDNEAVSNDLAGLEVINSTVVYALKQLQLQRIRSEIEMHKKIHDLQAEYDSQLAEFDAKRSKIVSGDVVPTAEECKYEFIDPEFPPPTESKDKGIPQFWPIIFHNLDLLSEMIQENDEHIIKHLVDVRYQILKEPRGFKLEFEFSENEFFTNKILTKEYYYSDKEDTFEPLQHEGLILNRAVGCKIDWKPEKDVTSKKVNKKMKHKSDNTVKTISKIEKTDSFFNFFDVPTEPIETANEETSSLLQSDFEIGETLRHSVIPRAIIYFTGEGIEDEDYDDLDEESDEFDEDDEEDYDEEDEEEEEEADGDTPVKKSTAGSKTTKSAGSRGKRGGGSGRGTAGGGGGGAKGKKEIPPECKQQ